MRGLKWGPVPLVGAPGSEQDARLVEAAVNAALLDGYRTKDLVGASRKFNTTAEVGAAIERQCADMAISHYAYHAV